MSKPPVEVERYYQKRAASIVDMLFEGGMFLDKLTRPDLQAIEDYLAFEFQSGIESGIRIKELMKKHKVAKEAPTPER